MIQIPGRRTVLRREPKQERSRDRIDEILKVAMALIGQTGIDGVTMKEIAALSGGPIASVYQYFPNKAAIISMLYERHCDENRDMVANYVMPIKTAEDVPTAAFEIEKQYYRRSRETPASQDLINAIQAHKVLQGMVLAETRFQANMFYHATCRFVPAAAREPYDRAVFLVFHLAAATVRLALMIQPKEGDYVVSNFMSIIEAQLSIFVSINDLRDFTDVRLSPTT